MLTWKIAWRNLLRHRGKSLVIGVILFLGAFLMILGDALIEGAKQGLAENMINRFTGHVVLAAAKEKKQEVFFGFGTLKVLPNYPQLKAVLEKQTFIANFLPLTRGMAMILNDAGRSAQASVYGVNFEEFQRMYLDNVLQFEGTLLKKGERGVLIGRKAREQFYDFNKFWVVPEGVPLNPDHLTPAARKASENNTLTIKSDLVFLGQSVSSLGNDIRLPVKGIIRLKSLDAVFGEVCFMDIESYRECFGHITAADNTAELSEEQKAALATDNPDDLFSDTDVVKQTELNTQGYNLETMQQQTQRAAVNVNTDNGAYNIVTVKLKPGISIPEGEKRLRQALADAKVDVKVVTWQQAIGEAAQFATISQSALFVFVVFIFFVAIIIIMNTLSMAAIERTSEIGMMRAVGARKSFISKMFFAETSLLSFLFGGLGIVVGIIAVFVVVALKIPVTSNEILNLLFASDTVHPIVNGLGLVSGIIQLAIVTLLAMLYPIRVATKITPLEAISRD